MKSSDHVFPMPFVEGAVYQKSRLGLTKRELFAAMAMQTMATKSHGEYNQHEIEHDGHLFHPRWVAGAAVDYADALLAELDKNE